MTVLDTTTGGANKLINDVTATPGNTTQGAGARGTLGSP